MRTRTVRSRRENRSFRAVTELAHGGSRGKKGSPPLAAWQPAASGGRDLSQELQAGVEELVHLRCGQVSKEGAGCAIKSLPEAAAVVAGERQNVGAAVAGDVGRLHLNSTHEARGIGVEAVQN